MGWEPGLPSIILDRKEVIQGATGMIGHKSGGWANVTDTLRYAVHTLSVGPASRASFGAFDPIEFTIRLVTPPGNNADFQVTVYGETITSRSSQAMDKLTKQWPDLVGVLSD